MDIMILMGGIVQPQLHLPTKIYFPTKSGI